MATIERRIKLDDRVIDISTLNSLMLDVDRPIREQQDEYRRGIDNLRAVFDTFRFVDSTIGMFQAPHYARVPITEFMERKLVSEEGISRLHLIRDEIWTSFDTKVNDWDHIDSITMSYVARYNSYDEMKREIITNSLPHQEQKIKLALPEADTVDNHITLEEVYELHGWDLTEVRKQLTSFHFHVSSESRVGFLSDREFEPIQLVTPAELSSRAFNRVLCASLLPFLITSNSSTKS